jgi:uncharacterized protein (UPF0276 family)
MTPPAGTGEHPVRGAGLGLRRALLGPLRSCDPGCPVDFMEIAPENWMGVGGRRGRLLREYTNRFPFVCHGLSLSIGGPSPLDETFLHRLRQFLDHHHIRSYSEHLSYCTDDGHLYDLMPIPFTEEAVRHVAQRVRRVQDILERRIALENVSYYAAPGAELSELEFVSAVLDEANCDLLLDVNNIYVNSVNHGYDAVQFLNSLPGGRIAYGHIAGHHEEAADLIVDTHGAGVVNGVWALLDRAYQAFGVFPTLLERDFNIPPVEQLLGEVEVIKTLQQKHQEHANPSRRKRA